VAPLYPNPRPPAPPVPPARILGVPAEDVVVEVTVRLLASTGVGK
jgi:hypothetical protein